MAIEISSGGVSETYRYYPQDALYVDANGNVNANGSGKQVTEVWVNGKKYYPDLVTHENGTTKRAIATGSIDGVLVVDYSNTAVVHGYNRLSEYIPISEVPIADWRTNPIARIEKLPPTAIPFSIQCEAVIHSNRVNISHGETESERPYFRYSAGIQDGNSSSDGISDAICYPEGASPSATVTTSSNYIYISGVVRISIGEVTFTNVFSGVNPNTTLSYDANGYRHHELVYPEIECVVDSRNASVDGSVVIDNNIVSTARRFNSNAVFISIRGKGTDKMSNRRLTCRTDTHEIFGVPSPEPTQEYSVSYSASFNLPYSEIHNIDDDSDYWPDLS